jgi:carbon monoxide dehydrogenase subunit G
MAYLRDEKEKLEIDYPIEKVWAAIPAALKKLEWDIEEKDDAQFRLKLKTKSGFLSFGTVMHVEAKAVDEKTTRMTLNAETPVTTITSMIDFGRTRDRVDLFIEALAKQMEKEKKKKQK